MTRDEMRAAVEREIQWIEDVAGAIEAHTQQPSVVNPYRRAVDALRALLAREQAQQEAMAEWLAAADESVATSDDVASMLRYGRAVDRVRALLAPTAAPEDAS